MPDEKEIQQRLEENHDIKPENEVEIVDKEEVSRTGPNEQMHYSEIEQAAIEQGWRPKNEFSGDMTDWVDAKTFLRQGELLKTIHNQNRKLKKMEGVVGTMAKQQKKMFDAGYAKAKKELRERHRQAVRAEDDQTAEALEEQMDQLDARKAQVDRAAAAEAAQAQIEAKAPNPDFVAWVDRNQWFARHPAMKAYAEEQGFKFARENKGVSNSEVWAHVERVVKQKFPERFPDYDPEEDEVEVRPRRTTRKSSAVEGDTTVRTRGTRSVDRIELTPEEKTVARMLVKGGHYSSVEEYAKELKKFGVK